MDRRPRLRAPSASALSTLLALLALLAAPARARADLEARCPAGYTTLTPPSNGGGERPIVVCVQPPMQLVLSELSGAIAPGSPEEARIATGITQMGEGGNLSAGPFHNETVSGHAARVSEITGTAPNEAGGAPTRVEGTLILMPAGTGTAVMIGLSQDATRGNARTAVRAMVPTIAGLDGSRAPARVSATCPAGLSPAAQANPQGPGGMRRVILCADGEGTRRLDVLESRLPVRAAAEARSHAETMATAIGRQLQQIGGSANAAATETVTFRPGLTGFVTPVHGQASPPGAPPGAGGITFEGLVAVLPTTGGGHAQVTVSSQNEPADAVRARLRAFVTGNLRLDGSGVPAASAAGDGGAAAGTAADDGGASSSASTPPPPTPRRREIDPNLPLWSPDEDQGGARDGGRGGNAPGASGSQSEPESDSARTGRYATYGFVAVVVLLLVYLFRRR